MKNTTQKQHVIKNIARTKLGKRQYLKILRLAYCHVGEILCELHNFKQYKFKKISPKKIRRWQYLAGKNASVISLIERLVTLLVKIQEIENNSALLEETSPQEKIKN